MGSVLSYRGLLCTRSDCRPQCGPSHRDRLLGWLSVNGLDCLAVAAMYVPANVERTGSVIVCCIIEDAATAPL